MMADLRWTIRPAQVADAAPLAQLAKAVFCETYGAQIPAPTLAAYVEESFAVASIQKMLQEAHSPTWIASVDGQMAGFLQFRLDSPLNRPHTAELARLYLDSSWQGKGIAHSLLEAALPHLTQQKIDTLWLYVWQQNLRAIAFYRKQGFSIVGEAPVYVHDICFEDWVMSKRI